ncbi:hypothetical protein RWH45_01435 [Microbacterium sp. KSW4-17]|uniref:DUF3558 domain-containing protein n=1 Tax=Microbacterium galbum TaxID=3075994 RepID=A0ABU3T3D8_9MICO|nr:hypothetical protein [Microbacterium sp. KSW4-17]MDU0365855.1 hypothetical protein [Microbacterium sp. KSW4-17]
MNDELTPEERAALRARIVGAAREITPVGAHRGAWIAGSIAAVLVVGIAGGVAVTSTLGAPQVATSPSPTPTASIVEPAPTPTPSASSVSPPERPEPAVVLGGRCEALLDADEAGGFIPEAVASPFANSSQSTPPRQNDMLGLLGGLSCAWSTDQDGFSVTVVPSAALPDGTVDAWRADERCGPGELCLAEKTIGDLWVGVNWWDPAYNRDPSPEVTAAVERVRAAAQDVLSTVEPRLAGAVGVPRDEVAGAPLPACAELDALVSDWAGADVETGYPSDNVASGPVWDIAVAAGVARFCGWSSYPTDGSGRALALGFYTQPLLGEPAAADLEERSMRPIDIPGTSAAWIEDGAPNGVSTTIIAVVGETRLTVYGNGRDTGEWVDLVSRLAADLDLAA